VDEDVIYDVWGWNDLVNMVLVKYKRRAKGGFLYPSLSDVMSLAFWLDLCLALGPFWLSCK